jgi:outer membrane protein OmpA-like peptidoglycan-associated protein/tetratricopeptide (TPR) repeat protein
MKRSLILFLFFATCSVVFAQKSYVGEAKEYFRNEDYCEGAAKCTYAYGKITPKQDRARKLKGEMAFKAAECYRFTEKFADATDWYDKAILLRYYEVEPKVYLNNGKMYLAMGEFEKAKENFGEYLKLVPGDAEGQQGMGSIERAESYKAERTRHVITILSKINKPEYDMSPMFGDRKNKEMYFTSMRQGSTGTTQDPRSCQPHSDIWVTTMDKKDNFGQPVLVNGELINTEDNEGTVCFDGRKKQMFFTRCPNEKKKNLGCDIWVSEAASKGWEAPVKLNLKTSDTVSVGHPCVSEDGKFLIFASDMPGGKGGKDLWYTTYDRRSETWTTPQNMGPEINTPGNELFPTFALDGSLYYASDGLPGMGGLDIFKASKVKDSNVWIKPTNVGYPLNSVSNDYGLIERDEDHGFFTSNRRASDAQGEYADEIWGYTIPPNLYTLKVIVVESNTSGKGKRIANAKVKVTGTDGSTWEGVTNDLGEVYFEKKPDESRYINEETEYVIEARLDGEGDKGYYPNSGGISTIGVDQNRDFVKEIALLPKTPIRLPEVRYALAKWDLLVNEDINSKDSLNYVYDLLEKYPKLIIRLTSHTDARGSSNANRILAQKRAQSCVDYLVKERGVDSLRLQASGRGEDQPRVVWLLGGKYLVDNPDVDSAQQITLTEAYINQFKKSDKVLFEHLHQLNRRTEGEVVSFDYVKPEPAKPVEDSSIEKSKSDEIQRMDKKVETDK